MSDDQAMVRTTVLMSAENPGGWKLEELLPALLQEIFAKCLRINGDARPVARDVLANNIQVLALFAQAEALQRDTLARLDTLGADQGPRGGARIGTGSAGGPAQGSASS